MTKNLNKNALTSNKLLQNLGIIKIYDSWIKLWFMVGSFIHDS